MRIQILGTGAAEGWPALFCGCKTCARVRNAGGKDRRSRSSIQIDDIYKIDLPPDTYYHTVEGNLDLSRLAYLFISHSHEDHLALSDIKLIAPPFAHNLENSLVNVYGSELSIGKINAVNAGGYLHIKTSVLQPFVPVKAGDLTFIPVLAVHEPGEICFNYVIQSESATVLYTCDTGIYPDATREYILGLKFDLLILECTLGNLDLPNTSHMGFRDNVEFRNLLLENGAITRETPVVLTHFSHNIGMCHKELEAIAHPEGMEVAYDGMVLEI